MTYLVSAFQAYQETGMEESFWGQPDENGIYWIDKLIGTNELRGMIEEGKTAEEIKKSWEEEISQFRDQRKPYLLYEE